MTKWHAALLLTALAGPHAGAEIYRYTDSQGNVEFSDQPRKGAERIEIKETATIQMPQPSDVQALIGNQNAATDDETSDAAYQTLEIAYPAPDSAFNSGSGDFSVVVDMQPPLSQNHTLQASLDGQVVASSKSAQIPLSNVFRGTHTIVVEVLEAGKVIQSTSPVTFTVHRPSKLN